MGASWAQIPNALSLTRIPLGIAFLLLYDVRTLGFYIAALTMALLAIASDFTDGRLARRWNVASETGYFLDGLCDKAFYVAVLLVMMRDDASNSLLIWGLIMREVFLYALRSIDSEKERNMASLRPFSLLYALFIRLYFLNFVVTGAFKASGEPPPLILHYGDTIGYLAAATGYYSIVRLARTVARED